MILVSACLVGINCKYNGKNNFHKEIKELVDSGKAIPICPEQLGGLATPRVPAEIRQDINGKIKVINIEDKDVTAEYFLGAERALKFALAIDTKLAIFQSRSPSCGCGKIYDGTFSKKLIAGNGVTTNLFLKNGIKVLSEEEYLKK